MSVVNDDNRFFLERGMPLNMAVRALADRSECHHLNREQAWCERNEFYQDMPTLRPAWLERKAALLKFERKLEWRVITHLMSGELVGRGCDTRDPASVGEIAIAPDRWRGAHIKWEDSAICMPGYKIAGIRIFAAEFVSPTAADRSAQPFNKFAVERWYDERIEDLRRAGARSSIQEDFEAAQRVFEKGVTRALIRDLRERMPKECRKKPGRPKQEK